MDWITQILAEAVTKIFSWDENLYEIVAMSLLVSMLALLIASLLAIPFAAWLSLKNTWIRKGCVIFVRAFMGFPPAVAGLIVYIILSRRGPLGDFGLLFSPSAMVIAQVLLIFPIVCGLSHQVFLRRRQTLSDLFYSLSLSVNQQLKTVIYESRADILMALVTGLGRGLAEVGAVMIVGGNILHYTRTLTTSIVLETSKGELEMAVSLGLILLLIAFLLNVVLIAITRHFEKSVNIYYCQDA